jgi:type II secretory pathway pseudopilin PulG
VYRHPSRVKHKPFADAPFGGRHRIGEPGNDRMKHSRFDIPGLLPFFRNRTSFHGFTYVALLAAIVIIGITLGATGKYWSSVTARDKEEELLFRGEQYRAAIERYYRAVPGRNEYPQSIDDLLKDNRTAQGRRHLRQKYRDPITGEDFEVIREQARGNRITGVFSKSDREPLRKKGFPEPYQEFEGKNKYSEWKFIFRTGDQPPSRPVGMGSGG